MGAFLDPSNGTYAVAAVSESQPTLTAGTGMTILGNNTNPTLADEWATGNIATPQMAMGANGHWGIIGIEIKAAASSRRPIIIYGSNQQAHDSGRAIL
jgi:hypothetical protein